MPEASRSSAEIAALEARLAALERELRADRARVAPGERLKLLGPLVGGLAHDFNNLLMVILGNAEIGLMDAAPQSPTQASLEQIRTAALRAADFCRKMMAYAGRSRLDLRPANLSELVSSLREDVRAAAGMNVAMKFELDDELPAIDADAPQAKQLLMNLVSNAVEALAGAIVIRTGVMAADQSYLAGLIADRELPSGPYVFLEVADNGHGMNEDTAARICDPLFSTRGKTRGLGMTVAIGIVRGHHGALRVESALGLGTTIRVLFPPAAGVGHDFRIVPGELAAWRGNTTALIVDAQEQSRFVAATILEHFGLETMLAADYQRALDAFGSAADNIGLVVLDLDGLPTDPAEALRPFRKLRPDVKFLFTRCATADAASTDAGPILTKPYSAQQLASAAREVLGG